MQTKADKGGGGSLFAIFLWTSFMDDPLLWNANRNSYVVCRLVPFPMTLSDPYPRFQAEREGGAVDVLCAQLMCDLLAMLAIAKFLVG